MRFDLRRAEPAQAAVLGDLGFAAWAASAFAIADAGRVDRERLRAQFRDFGSTHASTMLVALRDGDPLGWGAREGGDDLISDLWVGPAHQGIGVGSALLAAITGEIAAAGYTSARLETLASNAAAIRFYEKHGFVVAWRAEKFSSTLGYAIDKVGMNKSLTA